MNTIALFSNATELEILEKRADFDSITPIALTPAADAALEKYPNKRKTIEDY